MKISRFASFFSLFLLSTSALADFTLFQAGHTPVRIPQDLTLSASALSGGDLNRGTASQEVLRFIDSIKNRFGLRQVNGETLILRSRQSGGPGFSLRFIQRFNRVHIEGAELVAMFDRAGKLRGLNSSLMPTPPITVTPELSRNTALRIAVSEIGYNDPELGDGNRDGLLIVSRDRQPLLVWQFSLRERSTSAKPFSVQVVASGPNKGRINRVISLAHSSGPMTGDLSIYDASVSLVTPNPLYKGVRVLKNGEQTLAGHVLISKSAKDAHRNFSKVLAFYGEIFGRNSYDSHGANIDASVNVQRITILDLLGMKENAAWMGPWKMFIFGGGGDDLGDFASALDVVGHEYTHAVIETTSNLDYVAQSGALNESLADTFGAIINEKFERPSNPYLIGATVLRGKLRDKAPALRDMMDPHRGLSPQPATMEEFPDKFKDCSPQRGNDNCGVHILSGIPNRAAALVIDRLGWEKASTLFYRVMTARLRSTSDFNDYRNQTVDECHAQFGGGSDCDLVKAAFDQVGL